MTEWPVPYENLDSPCGDCEQLDCWCDNPMPKLQPGRFPGVRSRCADMPPTPFETNHLRFPPKSVDELNSVTARIMAMKVANEERSVTKDRT